MMNQTRILLGVILLLAGAFGYLQWSQQKTLAKERQEQKQMLEALLAAKNAVPAGAPAQPAAPAVQPAAPEAPAAPETSPTPSSTPAESTSAPTAEDAEKKRLALLQEEMRRMKEENEALKMQGQAATEERDRLAGELEVAKYQIDQRIAQIRSAPMIGRVTKLVPQHGFVVISAGRAAGIEPRDQFSIRRDGKIICQVQISDSVEDAEAVADPIRGTMAPDESIREGDEVVKLD